jgi:hypothetical protein
MEDTVVISGMKGVSISTPEWKADMTTMFDQVEELKNQIQAINNALTSLGAGLTLAVGPTPVVPLGAPLTTATSQVTGKLATITTKLNALKQ